MVEKAQVMGSVTWAWEADWKEGFGMGRGWQ